MSDSGPTAASANEAYVADLVKRNDPDRWLSALFAEPPARRALLALAAFDLEVTRIRSAVTQPVAGEIRMQWWRDSLEATTGDNGGDGHPVLAELRAAIATHRLPLAPFLTLIDARIYDLYDDPMPSMNDFEGYAGETTSALMRLAALCLDERAGSASAELAGHAGVAVALANALRRFPLDARRGHVLLPADAFAKHGVHREEIVGGRTSRGLECALADLRGSVRHHAARAAALLQTTPRAQRPPYLPVALVPALLSRLEKAAGDLFQTQISVPPLARLARIAWAHQTGQLISLRPSAVATR